MKKLLKVCVVLVLIFFMLYLSLWIFINVKGKAILQKQIKEYADIEVDIGALSFLPPLGVRIDDLSAENTKIVELKASIDLLKLGTGKIGFNEVIIDEAEFEIVRRGESVGFPFVPIPLLSVPAEEKKAQGEESLPHGMASVSEVSGGSSSTAIKHLQLKNVNVNFKDRGEGVYFHRAGRL